jgi:hypothetical protein
MTSVRELIKEKVLEVISSGTYSPHALEHFDLFIPRTRLGSKVTQQGIRIAIRNLLDDGSVVLDDHLKLQAVKPKEKTPRQRLKESLKENAEHIKHQWPQEMRAAISTNHFFDIPRQRSKADDLADVLRQLVNEGAHVLPGNEVDDNASFELLRDYGRFLLVLSNKPGDTSWAMILTSARKNWKDLSTSSGDIDTLRGAFGRYCDWTGGR